MSTICLMCNPILHAIRVQQKSPVFSTTETIEHRGPTFRELFSFKNDYIWQDVCCKCHPPLRHTQSLFLFRHWTFFRVILWNVQCDQICRFLKVLGDKFYVLLTFGHLLGCFEVRKFLRKTALLFLGNHYKIWVAFYCSIRSHWKRHISLYSPQHHRMRHLRSF